jgi:hypothetical protein
LASHWFDVGLLGEIACPETLGISDLQLQHKHLYATSQCFVNFFYDLDLELKISLSKYLMF